MVEPKEFFTRPARGMCQIYLQVINIFVDHFKTFAVLALLQSLVFIPVLVVFFIVAFVALASEMAVLSQTMNIGVRRLYESGGSYYDSSSSSSNNNNWDTNSNSFWDSSPSTTTSFQQTSNDALLPPGFWGFLGSVLGLYILFLATAICISSVFQGAFIRAASEIFAGRSPNWQAVLQIGWKKMCSIICFGFLYLATVIGVSTVWFAITLVLPMLGKSDPSFTMIFFSILVFILAYIVFTCAMTAGLTSIMVENKGAVAAVGRSWSLCKSSIGFIFCCILCFYILEILGRVVVRNILLAIFSVGQNNPAAAAAIMGLANWIMALLLGPVNAILNPVIYFSLRIQKEGLTMEELQSDLSLLEDSIELRTGDGIYSKVGNPSQDGSFTPMIADATAV